MTSSARMLMAGLALVVDTVIIIISAIWSDMIFRPLYAATMGFQYGSKPPLDPGMTLVIPGIYFGMLLCMWFALLYCVYMESIRNEGMPHIQQGGY